MAIERPQQLFNLRISVIVIIYNMLREAPRTLQSLSSRYQNVNEDEYEVIVVENGSSVPLSEECVRSFGSKFRYFYLRDASPSPAAAINFGVKQARGEAVGIMIDGARILSPGILKYARRAFHAYENPFITTLGWHLGPDVQFRSVERGYNCESEDELISGIEWPSNGYRLFEISAFAGSSSNGWFMPVAESNCLFLLKDTYQKLGGFDERFNSPGGGLANLDFYKRAFEFPDTEPVILLGEGTFHQIHGGVMTQVAAKEIHNRRVEFEREYVAIRKRRYQRPIMMADFLGHAPSEVLESILISADGALKTHKGNKSLRKHTQNFFTRALANPYNKLKRFKLARSGILS